jgi:hypothetical protein
MLEIPGCQRKVVDLLLRIQTLPDVKLEETQHVWALSDRNAVLWRDLPWYDGNWWVYQSHWRRDTTYATPERKAMAINQATAEAMMERSRLMEDGVGLGFEGLARLADALEDEKANLEVEIPMVREWLVHAGDLLHGLCETQSRTSNSVNGSKHEAEMGRTMRDTDTRRGLWQGIRGPSTERWEFWKDRLVEIERDQDIDQATRKALEVAIKVME